MSEELILRLMKAASQPEAIYEEDIRQLRGALSTYCRKRGEVCDGYFKVMRELGSLLASARLSRLRQVERGIDASLGRVLTKIAELYAEFVIGGYVMMGERVLVKVTEDLTLGGKRLRRGEMTALGLGEALVLASIGVVRPIRSVAVELG